MADCSCSSPIHRINISCSPAEILFQEFPLSALAAKFRVTLYRGICFVDGSVHILTLYIDTSLPVRVMDSVLTAGLSADRY
jgi:hypothetical protein